MAAISAKNAGAKVLLIEKGPKQSRGGNSRFTDCNFKIATEDKKDYLRLVDAERLPKEEIQIDPLTKDEYYNTLMRLSEGLADKRLTEVFVSRSFETVLWMKEQGFKWDLNTTMAFKRGKEILNQPGSVAFQIFDAKVVQLLRADYQTAVKVESNSLKGLAEELDIDAENFVTTVEEFNKAVIDEKPFVLDQRDGRRTKGLTPDKTNWAQRIDKPPYCAFAVVCGITFSYGGLKTNEKAQVIDTSDRPIRGLYAVGEIAGGCFYHNYPGGAGLTKGAVMGKIAGAEAALNI